MRDDYPEAVHGPYLDRFELDPTRAKTDPPKVVSLLPYRVAPKGTPASVLRAAGLVLADAAKILGPRTWVQGLVAVGPGNFEIDPLDPRAFAWSLDGAMFKAIGATHAYVNSPGDIAWRALSTSIWSRHWGSAINYFNDNAVNVEEVLAEIHAALELVAERAKTAPDAAPKSAA